ncbi:MAG: flagellar biosynthesis protein FlhB [Planctomycetes bacterium]|nr:flagellar biosynthesis protein FlhB [Planctomycetota bacterium]
MASDQGEKTEEPTAKRKQESREKGQTAKSPDLSGSFVLLIGCSALFIFGGWMTNQIVQMCVYCFEHIDSIDISQQTVNAHATNGALGILLSVMPLMASIFVAAFAISAMQVGFAASTKPFEPDWSRMDPIKGVGRLFSKRSFMRMTTGIIKTLAVGTICWLVISGDATKIAGLVKNMSTIGNPARKVAAYIVETTILMSIYCSFLLVILSFIDYAYQRWQSNEDMKMSKHEVKDEMRNMEGDPQMKRKRMEIQRQIAQGGMMRDAADADVMVTNPTHYTVAIRYKPDEQGPVVVAKGVDNLALKLREIAAENGIPVIERKELARGLFRWVNIGETVPEKFWKAVAEVLAMIWKSDEKKKAEFASEEV